MWIDGFRKSFIFKLFISYIVSVMLILTAFSSGFAWLQSKAVKDRLIREGRMLAGLLSNSTRTWVYAERKDMLKDAVVGVMGQKNVVSTAFYTPEGSLIYSEVRQKGKNALTSSGRPIKGEPRKPWEKAGSAGFTETDGEILFYSPVILDAAPDSADIYFGGPATDAKKSEIGYVEVVIDKRLMKSEIRSIFVRNGIIAAAFLLIGSTVMCIAIRKVTLPLIRLTNAVKSIGMGGEIADVEVESSDEVGRLAGAFNSMFENLRKREAEKVQLEEKLRHAQKMEAVGTLARGVAHDFNNILTTLQGAVFIIRKKLDYDDHSVHYIERMSASIGKAKGLIQGLLTFSRTQMIHPKPVDINVLAAKLSPVLKNIAGDNIEVKIIFSRTPAVVMADPVQMDQIFMNLCSNSRDAMPEGGIFTIEITEPVLSIGDESVMEVMIRVTDNGVGIPEEIRSRVFEPFFTTKSPDKGTGLGLSIVYGIIKQHNGRLELKSGISDGTEFDLYFPIYSGDQAYDVSGLKSGAGEIINAEDQNTGS